jgi:ActR/RegA family two-component response regulator
LPSGRPAAETTSPSAGPDLATEEPSSLTEAIHRHVRRVYEHCSRNQRRTAKLLGISRSRLDRYLLAIGNGKS